MPHRAAEEFRKNGTVALVATKGSVPVVPDALDVLLSGLRCSGPRAIDRLVGLEWVEAADRTRFKEAEKRVEEIAKLEEYLERLINEAIDEIYKEMKMSRIEIEKDNQDEDRNTDDTEDEAHPSIGA